jgi:hypothetical protein
MAPIKGSLPNLLNGVSRQPMSVRLPTQLEEQINGFSTPARGLQKRPPTFHIAKVTGIPANTFVHHINRDQAERYKVLVTDGDLKVSTWTGREDCHVPEWEGLPQLRRIPNRRLRRHHLR